MTDAIKVWDIHGGVHPEENKQQSLGSPIRNAGIPPELILPLAQAIGAPAEPCVAIGDTVLKGQLIAKAGGHVSASLHAPTSGTVTAIESRQVAHSSGLSADCIVIETDGEDRWAELKSVENPLDLQSSDILKRIRNAGIAGMGGAGFPSAVKLSPPKNKPITTLIVNATECEPYITADHILIRERAADIVSGIDVLVQLMQPSRVLIGLEDNKPDAADILRKEIAQRAYSVVEFPTKYPSGGEKQLIEILTGKQVPSGGLPADLGIVCHNIGSCVAIKEAVLDGKPLVSRITTLTGNSLSEQCNLEVLIGTPMRFLLEQCGWQEKNMSRLIMGGPMMGFTVPTADVPVVKTTNCILAPTEAEIPSNPPAQACIRCGMCAEACPASLLPQQLYWFARSKEYERLEEYNLADCIECGACSYVCPSNIPLVQYYRASKADIRERDEEHRKAEHSRERFEFRQERLEAAEREKEERKKARKAAAAKRSAEASAKKAAAEESGAGSDKNGTDAMANTGADKDEAAKQAEIQAAIERVKAKKAAATKPDQGAS